MKLAFSRKTFAGIAVLVLVLCAVPPDPTYFPPDFDFEVTTPNHSDTVYYLGDTLRLRFTLTSFDSISSITINAESILDTIISPVRSDSFSLARTLANGGTKNISVTAVLKDGTKRDTTFHVIIKGHAPVIVSQADTLVRCVIGDSCSVWVQAQGTAPLRYQWFRNDTMRIADTLATRFFLRTQLADAGVYYCVVSNGWNPPDTSNKIRIILQNTGKVTDTLSPIDSLTPAIGATGVEYAAGVMLSWKGGVSTRGAPVSYIVKWGSDTASLAVMSTQQQQVTLMGIRGDMRYFWCVFIVVGLDTVSASINGGKYATFTTKKTAGQPSFYFSNINDFQLYVGDTLRFLPEYVSSDSSKPTITANLSRLPQGNTAKYDSKANTLTWTPSAGDTGKFNVVFSAAIAGNTILDTMQIDVKKKLKDPEILVVADTTTKEGALLTIVVRAINPLNPSDEITTTLKPAGSTFTKVGGQYVFSWTPGYDAADYSPYSVTFRTPGVVYFVDKTIKINVTDLKYRLKITQPTNGLISQNQTGKEFFEPGQAVTLTTTTTNDSCYFESWTGDLNGTVNPRTVAMNADLNVSAKISYMPVAANPVFSPTVSNHLNFVNVLLSTSTQGATIYYTLDGSTPMVGSSKIYSSAFSLTSSATVKAFAACPGYIPSQVVSKAFTINHSPAFKDSTLPERVYIMESYGGKVSATDSDGDVLRYSKITGPDCMTVDSITGAVSFFATRTCVQPGTYNVVVQVSDGKGGTAQKTWLVQAIDNALPLLTVTTPLDSSGFSYIVQMDGGISIDFGIRAIDSDGKIDSVKFYINDSLVATKTGPSDPNYYYYQHRFVNPNFGPYWYAIKFRAYDNRKEYSEKVVNIKIDAINYKG